MKKTTTFLAALLCATMAAATGTPPPPPKSANHHNSSNTSSSSSGAIAGAAAGANSQATSGSKATGGNATGGTSTSSAAGGAGGSAAGGAGGSADSSNQLGNIGTDNSSSSFRSVALALPSPAFTPPLPMASARCERAEQHARSVALGVATWADAVLDTDNCVALELHNRYIASCKYASAAQVEGLLTAKVLPGFKPGDASRLVDLTNAECTALKAPVLAPTALTLPPAVPTSMSCLIVEPPMQQTSVGPARKAAVKKTALRACS